jgi:hypothetical protein
MDVPRKQILKKLRSISKPKLTNEGMFPGEKIVRVFTREGGYLFQTDEYPISGPFSMIPDEFNEARRVVEKDEDAEEYLERPEEHIEMVAARCEPGVEYYRYQMNVRSETPIYSESLDELEQMFIEDIMNNIDCQPWDNMSDSELNEWDIWYDQLDR